MKYEYQIDNNCHRSRVKTQAVLAWVNSKKEYGQSGRRPTTDEFIKEAFRRGSPMCKAGVLEKNARKAAEQYWYTESQYYLRHINVIKIDIITRKATPPIRAFIPIKYSQGGRIRNEDYKSAKRVCASATDSRTVLQMVYSDLIAFAERYQRYSRFFPKEYSAILSAIKKLPQPPESEVA